MGGPPWDLISICKFQHREWINLIMTNYPPGLQSFIFGGGNNHWLPQRGTMKLSEQSLSIGEGTLKPRITWTSFDQWTHRREQQRFCLSFPLPPSGYYPSDTGLVTLPFPCSPASPLHFPCTHNSLSHKLTVTFLPSISPDHSLLSN